MHQRQGRTLRVVTDRWTFSCLVGSRRYLSRPRSARRISITACVRAQSPPARDTGDRRIHESRSPRGHQLHERSRCGIHFSDSPKLDFDAQWLRRQRGTARVFQPTKVGCSQASAQVHHQPAGPIDGADSGHNDLVRARLPPCAAAPIACADRLYVSSPTRGRQIDDIASLPPHERSNRH